MTTNWSDAELEASVRSYLEMKDKELKGIKFTKVDYYRDLSKKFGRSEKSFEYRMQNISFVFSQLGRERLAGLKPAKNVGSHVFGKIDEIIDRIEREK
tara:strand:+ start:154 stop:447 length:294 start_codon:yes stop_codon:yes gene_type:complete